MLQPKRTKFRKQQKGRNRGLAQRGNKVSFGDFALKSVSRGRMTSRQIEAARRTITRHVKRGGKLWIRVFPDVPITKKPIEVRQGKGKGNVNTGLRRFSLAGCSTKLKVSVKKLPARHSRSQLQSCHLKQPLWHGR